MGQGEVGGYNERVQTVQPCLGLFMKSPWLELSRTFVVLILNGPRKIVVSPYIASNSRFKADFSARGS